MAPLVTLLLTAIAVSPSAAPASDETPVALPPGVVAQVGDEHIGEGEFDHWLAVFARRPRLVPPEFERCVGFERRRDAQRERNRSRKRLRQRCLVRYARARRQALTFLIQGLWIETEAADRGVEADPTEVRAELRRERRRAFPKRGEYREFLRRSGTSQADVLHRLRLTMLQARIADDVIAHAPRVTRADVTRHLRGHPRARRGKSRREARREARELLATRRAQRALGRFIARFSRDYRRRTTCAHDHPLDLCGRVVQPGPADAIPAPPSEAAHMLAPWPTAR